MHQHEVKRRGDADEIAATGDLDNLPRPWSPAACDDELRLVIWGWCDAVAAWINHEYTWRAAGLIPACWPYHPHIAHELPAVALARYAAEISTGPGLLDTWHRETLPGFLNRILDRLGESKCRLGEHVDWPAAARHAAFTADATTAGRRAAFRIDTGSDGDPDRSLRAIPEDQP